MPGAGQIGQIAPTCAGRCPNNCRAKNVRQNFAVRGVVDILIEDVYDTQADGHNGGDANVHVGSLPAAAVREMT